MKPVFNYRPRPLPGESFRGYLLRLTDVNGYSSVSGVVNLSGISFSSTLGADWTRLTKSLISELEDPLKMESGELGTFFNPATHPLSRLSEGQRRRVYRKYAAVCPACIKSDGYIRGLTDNAMLPICPIHGVQLIDQCPRCCSKISHNRSELDQCADCGSSYSETVCKIEDKNDAAYTLVRQIYSGKIRLDTALAAMDRMARAVDFIPAAPDYGSMSIQELCSNASQAAGLLYSKAFRAEYRTWLVNELRETRVINEHLPAYPLDHFLENHKVHSFSKINPPMFSGIDHYPRACELTVSPVETARLMGVEASRLRCWKQGIERVDLSRQIIAEHLAVALGLKQSDLKSLSDAEILPALNDVRTARHAFFDINEVVNLMKRLTTAPPSNVRTEISLGEARKELPFFAATNADLIQLILEGRVKIIRGSNLLDFRLDLDQTRFILHQKLVSQNDLSGNDVAKILVTNNKQLIELRESFKCDIAMLTGFKHDGCWISLNRVASMTSLRMKKLQSLLAQDHIMPLATVPGKQKDLLLYALNNKFRFAVHKHIGSKDAYCGFL